MRAMATTGSLLRRALRRCHRLQHQLDPAPLGTHISDPTRKREGAHSAWIHDRHLSSTVEASFDFQKDQLHDDVGQFKKDTALKQVLSQLAVDGHFDSESRLWLSRFSVSRIAPVISTGSLKLDLALEIGGLPKGRIVEIYGKEASGKTTIALHIIKEAQKHGGCCAYLDVENAVDPSLLQAIGIDTGKLLFSHPDSAENTLSTVNTLVHSGAVDVIVLDSVAALIPQCELDNALSLTHDDIQSRLMAQALRKIHYSSSRSQALVVFVNQVREDIGPYASHGRIRETTCGGNALKFYSAVRLRTARAGLLQSGEEISGIRISVEVIKNKLAAAKKSAEVNIGFGRGMHIEREILDLASKHGFIMREGNIYQIKELIFESREEAEKYLSKNRALVDELTWRLRKTLFEGDR